MATPRKRWWSVVVRAAMSSRAHMRPYSIRAARADEGIDLTPQNLRILWSRIQAAQAESHHVAAQQLAIGRSGGVLSEHVTMFASLCSAPDRDAFRDLQRVRLGASSRPKHRPRAYVRERRKSINQELMKGRDMTEKLDEISTSSLSAWSIKAAGAAMHHGARIHHIMRYLGVEFVPSNIRAFWVAVRAARLELHHDHARQIALIKSDGQCMDYAQLLVRWTALETAEAAEKEYLRICRELRDDGVDPRVLAAECRRTVLVQMSRNGIFADDGQPLPGTEGARARALTSAHVAAYYDHDKPRDQALSELLQSRAAEKGKEKQEQAAKDDGLLNWLNDEHLGETISDETGTVEVMYGDIPTVRIYKATQKFSRTDDARKQTSDDLEKRLELRGVATESENTETISTVYNEHPWLAEPIDYVWKRRQDAIEDGRPWFQIPPILIWGPPGCGKTHFLSRLAELSGVQYRRLDYSSVEGGMSIAGTDARWSNSRPGAIVETIAQTGCANPLFFIDEVEKAKKNHGASDPHHALLPLLQQDTARTFCDPSLSAQVDLSFVSYAFAANEIWQIPAPLLDRVRVFEVRYPRGKHLRELIERRLIKLGASEEVIDKVHAEIESGRHTLRILDRIEMRLREVMRQPVLN